MWRSELSVFILLLTALAGTWPAAAAVYTNKANKADLNSNASWNPNGVPGAADSAHWEGATRTDYVLGANTAWLGIRIGNILGPVLILNSAHRLALGSGGIDMAAASSNLTLKCTLLLS